MQESEALVSYHKTLMELSHRRGFIHQPRQQKLAELTRLCAELLNTERVSVWRLSPDRDRITCEWLHDLSLAFQEQPEPALELFRDNHPAYFDALIMERVIAVDDARQDERTRSFGAPYLIPEGIHAMLDAPIFDGERMSGVICLETRAPHAWTLPEISLVVAIADTISLINTHEAWLSSKRTIDYMSRYDSMTGLANLSSLKDRIEQLIRGTSAYRPRNLTLIWVDIDRLKSINDGLGPKAGDQVIAELGQRLKTMDIGDEDLLARIGGDEFAVLFKPENPASLIESVPSAIHERMAEPVRLDDHELVVSVSLGICQYPADGTNAEELLRAAEAAMYNAKREGRARSIRFDSEIQMTARSRFVLERDLRATLDQEALDVFYQPIMDRTGTHLESMEALVRWNHPQRGWMSPIEFLDIARNAGLMYKLGTNVLKRVCAFWRSCNDSGTRLPIISVNLAAEQVLVPELPDLVRNLCADHGMPVSALQFEVTEDAIQGELHTIRRVLEGLVEAGAELAIDDFGTGHSSLSRLKSLPFSRIKIDRSFIRDLPGDEDDCAITLSILGLARGLGLKVVAEGVESEEHEQWLHRECCDYLQGYRYSRPLPSDEFIQRFLTPSEDRV